MNSVMYSWGIVIRLKKKSLADIEKMDGVMYSLRRLTLLINANITIRFKQIPAKLSIMFRQPHMIFSEHE